MSDIAESVSIQLLEELTNENLCCQACDVGAVWLLKCTKCNDQGIFCSKHAESIRERIRIGLILECGACHNISGRISPGFDWIKI